LTREEFIYGFKAERIAVKCENNAQFSNLRKWASKHCEIDGDPKEWNPRYPYGVSWCGGFTGFSGTTNEHPLRFDYDEFVAIVNDCEIEEKDIQNIGDII